jgi:ribosomal protein L4
MSCRNLSEVMLVPVQGLNVYDLLRHEIVVVTRTALSMVEEAWKP